MVSTIISDLATETRADLGIKTMKRDLLKNMNYRFSNIESREELILATYLNPKYKAHFFRNSETKENARNLLLTQIEEKINISKPGQSDFSMNISESNESVHENSLEMKMKNIIKANSVSGESGAAEIKKQIFEALVRYEKLPTLAFKKSPLDYWKERSMATEKPWTKIKCSLAKQYLTTPPISCDVERLFSTASHILSKERNRLLSHNAEKLLFVHENISRVHYNYTTK